MSLPLDQIIAAPYSPSEKVRAIGTAFCTGTPLEYDVVDGLGFFTLHIYEPPRRGTSKMLQVMFSTVDLQKHMLHTYDSRVLEAIRKAWRQLQEAPASAEK